MRMSRLRVSLFIVDNENKTTARVRPDNNLALQEKLYQLRSETQDAFNEAKILEAKWKELEKEQRDVYQVRSNP